MSPYSTVLSCSSKPKVRVLQSIHMIWHTLGHCCQLCVSWNVFYSLQRFRCIFVSKQNDEQKMTPDLLARRLSFNKHRCLRQSMRLKLKIKGKMDGRKEGKKLSSSTVLFCSSLPMHNISTPPYPGPPLEMKHQQVYSNTPCKNAEVNPSKRGSQDSHTTFCFLPDISQSN